MDPAERDRLLPLFRYQTQPPRRGEIFWTVTLVIPDPARREGAVNYSLIGVEALDRFLQFCAAFLEGATGRPLSKGVPQVDAPDGLQLEYAQRVIPGNPDQTVQVVVRTPVPPRTKGAYAGREAGSAVITFVSTALPDLFAQFQRKVPGEH